MPPIDRLLSQYSDPIRSWPGEEELEAEARANYAAANPTPRLQRPEEVWRGSVLPLAEMRDKGSPNPSDWRSSGDVLKHLDQGSRWAVPGVIQDVMDAAQAIYDTSGWGLGPATRFSTLPEAERERIAELGVAGATAGVTGGLTRAAVAPRLPAGVTELGIFGGRKARTADLEALARAEEMTRLGRPREDVWSETGWFQGPDKQWRFEIDDSGMKPVINMRDWINRKDGVTLAPHIGAAYEKASSDLVPGVPVRVKRLYTHPELESAYRHGFTDTPEHAGITGLPVQLIEGGNASGAYIPEGWHGKTIGVHETLPPGPAKSTLLHELQHAVQDREGFAFGSSPGQGDRAPFIFDGEHVAPLRAEQKAIEAKFETTPYGTPEYQALKNRYYQLDGLIERAAAFEGYRRLAGETEARAVQARRDLTPEERRARPPWLDYDVPESDQIVRFGGEGPKMSVGDDALKVSETERAVRPEPDGLIPEAGATGASHVLAETPRTLSGLPPTRQAQLVSEALRSKYPGAFEVVPGGSAMGKSAYVRTDIGDLRFSDHAAGPRIGQARDFYGDPVTSVDDILAYYGDTKARLGADIAKRDEVSRAERDARVAAKATARDEHARNRAAKEAFWRDSGLENATQTAKEKAWKEYKASIASPMDESVRQSTADDILRSYGKD